MKHFYASLAFFLSLALSNAQAATYQPYWKLLSLKTRSIRRQQCRLSISAALKPTLQGIFLVRCQRLMGNGVDRRITRDSYLIMPILEKLLRQLGLTAQQPIVVYSSGADETDFGAAARVYWTLKYLGLTDLSILNGGLQQWQKAQQPLVTHTTQVQASQLTVQSNPKLVIFKDELLEKKSLKTTALISYWMPVHHYFFSG